MFPKKKFQNVFKLNWWQNFDKKTFIQKAFVKNHNEFFQLEM